MKIKKIFKRWIALALLLLIIVPVFSSYSVVFTDSNDLRASYISMAKKKTLADIDTNSITPDSLRIIALYLSNYYIPMTTSLDNPIGDDNDKDSRATKNKSTMVKVLQDSCGFDAKTAKAMVELVYKYSLSTAKPLWVVRGSDEDETIEDIADNLGHNNAGTSSTSFTQYKDLWKYNVDHTGSRFANGIFRGTMGMWYSAVGCYLTKDNDKNHISDKVKFCWDTSRPDETTVLDCGASCAWGYAEGMDGRNPLDGDGITFFTRTQSELKKVSTTDATSVITINSTLYVDWVGNIIMDDGKSRIIVLPACKNPYALTKIAEQGRGDRTPINNLISMYKMGKSLIKGKRRNNDTYAYLYVNMNSDSSVFDQDLWRLFRGSSDTSVDPNDISGNISTALESLGLSDWSNYLYLSNEMWDDVILGDKLGSNEDYEQFAQNGGSEPENKVLDTIVSIDNLQEYDSSNASTDLSQWFFSKSMIDSPDLFKVTSTFSSSTELGKLSSAINSADSGKLLWIYLTYVFAYSNYLTGATIYNPSTNVADIIFNGNRFPTTTDNNINWSDIDLGTDEMDNEIKSMIYYLLHPSEGMSFFKVWIKNKISAAFIGWHEDIVGATSSNASTGTTKYLGFSGYTSLPSLHDLSWTDWLLQNYNSIIVYLILIMSAILCCYIIVGSLTAQKAIISMGVFAVVAFLPPIAINSAVNIVNTGGDIIYGNKFTYWALVQHQTYLQDLYSATAGTETEYQDFVLKQQTKGKGATSSSSGFDCVKLKWMSPKKDNYLAGVGEALNSTAVGGNNTIWQMLKPLASGAISGEEFLDDNSSLYLYRDYMDVIMYSLKSYNLYNEYFGGTDAEGNNIVDKANGDYKLQVGYWWQGDKKNKDLLYSSGTKLSDTIYANYEKGEYANISKKQAYKDVSSVTAVKYGFLYNTFAKGTSLSDSINYYDDNQMSVNYLLNYTKAYSDMYYANKKIGELLKSNSKNKKEVYTNSKLNSYGIDQPNFNFSMSSLSRDNSDKYNKDNLDYFYYGLYSESPFYFFSYNLLDQLNATTGYSFSLDKDSGVSLGTENFKDLLLQDNSGYFYNTNESAGDGYGEMRDYMNLHDFFYYVLPLMKNGNSNVKDFDSLYGMSQYKDVRVSFTASGDVMATDEDGNHIISDIQGVNGKTIPTNIGTASSDDSDSNKKSETTDEKTWKEVSKSWSSEKKYKFWHNYNVAVVFNMYCTWADTMWDCNYADSETIQVAGKKYIVEFPLDPTSYFKVDKKTGEITEGRPMVFSKSEMKFYGLDESDLTTVEKKIVDLEETVYKKSIDYMNYYNFDDDVLVSAMAMLELFEFNKTFSQKVVIGKDYIMYPQSYELKTFSYDAYLRLIIANTTGEDLQTEQNESLYERVINNTSVLFGIMLVILDVMAVYIIPAFRLFFLIILFFLSVLVIVSSVVKIELNIVKSVWKSLIAPLLSFTAVSLCLSFVVSLFMFNGNKGVTGDLSPSIILGDPTMVCIVMCVINAVVIYLYFKICKRTFKDFITFAKAVGTSIGGAIGGAFSKLANNVTSGKTKYGSSAYNGVSSSPSSRGKNNMPKATGGIRQASSGVGGAIGGAAVGAGAGALAASKALSSKHKDKKQAKNEERRKRYGDKISKGEAKIKDVGRKAKESQSKYKENKQRLQSANDRRKVIADMRKNKEIGFFRHKAMALGADRDRVRYATRSVKSGISSTARRAQNSTVDSLGRRYYGKKNRVNAVVSKRTDTMRNKRKIRNNKAKRK